MSSGTVDFRPLATSRRPATELAVENVILVEAPAIAFVADLTTAAIAPAFCIAFDARGDVRVTPTQATPTPPVPPMTYTATVTAPAPLVDAEDASNELIDDDL
jgi:hypothetical protein